MVIKEHEIRLAISSAIGSSGGAQDIDFDTSRSLRECGISSLALYQFVAEVEKALAVEIPDCEFQPQNFSTLGAVEALLTRIVSIDQS